MRVKYFISGFNVYKATDRQIKRWNKIIKHIPELRHKRINFLLEGGKETKSYKAFKPKSFARYVWNGSGLLWNATKETGIDASMLPKSLVNFIKTLDTSEVI